MKILLLNNSIFAMVSKNFKYSHFINRFILVLKYNYKILNGLNNNYFLNNVALPSVNLSVLK